MNNYFDPFAMLVGRVGRVGTGDVLVESPARMPQAWLNPYPFIPGPGGGGIVPTPGGYGGCAPCFPLPDCQPQAPGFYARAMNSAVAAQGTQTALGVNSQDILGAANPIAAGGAATLSVSPTVPFCAVQLRVARTSSPFFDLTSIRAARIEYLTDGNAVPADDYSPDSNSPPLQLPMLFPGTQISTGVRNVDSAPHHYRAAFYGFPGPSCSPCL